MQDAKFDILLLVQLLIQKKPLEALKLASKYSKQDKRAAALSVWISRIGIPRSRKEKITTLPREVEMELYKVFRPDLSREGTLADDQTWERVKLTYEEVGYLQSLEEMEDFRVVLWERILSDEKYACLWFGELERMLLVRRKQLLNQEPVATPYWDALMRVYGK